MTPEEAAEWMRAELERIHFLNQETVAYRLQQVAPELIYINENGNLGIDRRVLSAFNAGTPDVVWSRSERHWRKRANYDVPGKRQQD